jgi:hypothetical protein
MTHSGSKNDYDVGYGKPPKSGQFKKGQSGNPSGKKHPPKLEAVLAKALAKTVVVAVDGKKQTLTMLELVIEALTRKAAKGEIGATKLLFSAIQTLTGEEVEDVAPLTAHQLALLHEIVAASKPKEPQL